MLLCRPCYGVIGDEPVEAEMFDSTDSSGGVQVALLPLETLSIPFSFVTFEPFFPSSAQEVRSSRKKHTAVSSRDRDRDCGGRRGREWKDDDQDHKHDQDEEQDLEPPEVATPTSRVVNIRIISGSHGHVIAVVKVHVHPRPFAVNRNITFYEPENTVMKRRIRLATEGAAGGGELSRRSHVPGWYNAGTAASKYVHCVETCPAGGHMLGADGGGNQVLVEWGETEQEGGAGALDLVVRYRCLEFPHVGSFYILIYNDPYQCSLHEVMAVEGCVALSVMGFAAFAALISDFDIFNCSCVV